MAMNEDNADLEEFMSDDYIEDAMDSLFAGGHRHILVLAKGNVPLTKCSYAVDDLDTLETLVEAFELEIVRIRERLSEE